MSNLTIFFIIFVVLLIIGSWITSEIISNKNSKSNKKFIKQILLLEKENTLIQGSLTKENERYATLKEEYESIKESKKIIREHENEYKKLANEFNRMMEGVNILRQKVSGKKYSSNSLAKEVTFILEEHCPTERQKEERNTEENKATFKRIKNAMGMG